MVYRCASPHCKCPTRLYACAVSSQFRNASVVVGGRELVNERVARTRALKICAVSTSLVTYVSSADFHTLYFGPSTGEYSFFKQLLYHIIMSRFSSYDQVCGKISKTVIFTIRVSNPVGPRTIFS